MRTRAAIAASTSQASTTSESITGRAVHQWPLMTSWPASGRNAAATQATATSRAAIEASRAGRPTARCGSAPISMPMAATATTCCMPCRAGSSWTRMSSAYASDPAAAIGAASRSPGSVSRSSSPKAIRPPNASAAGTPVTLATAVSATATTSRTPATMTSRDCPESRMLREYPRGS